MYQKIVDALTRQRDLIDQALVHLIELSTEEILSTKLKTPRALVPEVGSLVISSPIRKRKTKRTVSPIARKRMAAAQRARYARERKTKGLD